MVYGDFLACFPELQEPISVWTKEDRSDERKIQIVHIPTDGNSIRRRKYTSGNTGLDVVDEDHIFVHDSYTGKISTGDYFCRNDKIIWRVVGRIDYSLPGDYCDYTVERVTGANQNQQGKLPVKEAYFA